VLGLQPVREALRVHGAKISSVHIDRRDSPRLAALARFATDQGVREVVRVSRSELDATAAGVAHQGVAAWAPPLDLVPLATLLERDRLLAIALDGIQDPHNFGAVLRSAVGLAGAPVIWGEHASAPLTPATFRASAGAVEHAELCRVPSLVGALQEAADRGLEVVGLQAQAAASLREVDLGLPSIIVVGSEHEGLGRAVRRVCTQHAHLVPRASIDSLNASVAAAVALYEAVSQRAKSRA